MVQGIAKILSLGLIPEPEILALQNGRGRLRSASPNLFSQNGSCASILISNILFYLPLEYAMGDKLATAAHRFLAPMNHNDGYGTLSQHVSVETPHAAPHMISPRKENRMEKTKSIHVWDIFVRVFHWSLVGSMIGLYISGEKMESVHIRLGYFVIALLLARIIWGFIGTKHAKFADFLYSPPEIFYYLKSLLSGKPIHYTGHNPAGGLMVLVMLTALPATAFTGLKALATDGKGPLAHTDQSIVSAAYANGDENDENDHENYHSGSDGNEKKEQFWEKRHEMITNFMLFLIVIHISGVLVSSWLHKENLILSMITGKKRVSAHP
jgi:cytochrome b